MIPRDKVFTVAEKDLGKDPIATADRKFSEHVGQNKLLVVDAKNKLRGLFTLSDIERISEESRAHVRPTRDAHFRLRVGVAVSVPRTADGEIDYANHAAAQLIGFKDEAGAEKTLWRLVPGLRASLEGDTAGGRKTGHDAGGTNAQSQIRAGNQSGVRKLPDT